MAVPIEHGLTPRLSDIVLPAFLPLLPTPWPGQKRRARHWPTPNVLAFFWMFHVNLVNSGPVQRLFSFQFCFPLLFLQIFFSYGFGYGHSHERMHRLGVSLEVPTSLDSLVYTFFPLFFIFRVIANYRSRLCIFPFFNVSEVNLIL